MQSNNPYRYELEAPSFRRSTKPTFPREPDTYSYETIITTTYSAEPVARPTYNREATRQAPTIKVPTTATPQQQQRRSKSQALKKLVKTMAHPRKARRARDSRKREVEEEEQRVHEENVEEFLKSGRGAMMADGGGVKAAAAGRWW